MSNDDNDGPKCPGGSFVVPGPVVGGVRFGIRHSENHTVEVGKFVEVPDGTTIPEGVTLLHKRDGEDIYDVVGTPSEMRSSGPVRVTSNSYRSGWDGVFGSKTKPDSSLN